MTDAPTYIKDKLTILIEGFEIPPFQNHIQIPSFLLLLSRRLVFGDNNENICRYG